jgi:hypothetical protein
MLPVYASDNSAAEQAMCVIESIDELKIIANFY